ncbi:MAG: FHA domain-containing protein [Caldilineaceae bacterium]|nr:FHA domain-containing protein [Caldilineaceae bacterium]
MPTAVRLVLLHPERGEDTAFDLHSAQVTLGRATANDIDLLDPKVSRFHARLERDATGGWALVDLGSGNGSHVNGQRVERAGLHPGDELQLGDSRLRFEDAPAPLPEQQTIIDTPAQLDATLIQTPSPVQINGTEAPRLAVFSQGQAWEVPLGDGLSIGRQSDNGLVLAQPNVSRLHASIERRSEGGRDVYLLRDRESGNGTWIGPERIGERVLAPGDTIRIGDARLVFKSALHDAQETLIQAPPQGQRRPVVFVPGIMGSQLWLGNERVWPNVRTLFTNPEIFRLPDDAPLRPEGIVDEVVVVPNLIRQEQYSRLSDFLVESLGYVRGVDLLEFAYDWRQDVRQSARKLGEAIEAWGVTPPVTIIGHSLGTLVTRYFVERLGGSRVVDKLLLMGGPHQGVPEAVTTLLSGPNLLPFGLLGERLRDVLATFPSAYQILPRYACVQDESGDPVDIYSNPAWLPEERRPLLALAQEFQNELAYTPPSVPTVCIFGYAQKTLTDLRIRLGPAGGWQKLDLQRVDAGDNSVPQASAVLPGVDIHPVQQHHGSLYVDSDVRMRLRVELTWR